MKNYKEVPGIEGSKKKKAVLIVTLVMRTEGLLMIY